MNPVILPLLVIALGYRFQFWCPQFHKHVQELRRFKPSETLEGTAEPQAVQFNGAAKSLTIKSRAAYGAEPLWEALEPSKLRLIMTKSHWKVKLGELGLEMRCVFISKPFPKNTLWTFVVQARPSVTHHNPTP